jgi:peptidase M28-like protein
MNWMKKVTRILIPLLALTVAVSAAPPAIDADRLLAHVRFLASDEMKGRADGGPELNRAADYIAAQFREIGLTPGGDLPSAAADLSAEARSAKSEAPSATPGLPAEARSAKAGDRSWFQPFDLVAGLAVGRDNELVVRDRTRSVRLSLGSSYYPLSTVPNETPSVPSENLEKLPLVFAGFGLSAPQANYDDYAGLDVSGKAVIIFTHEPQESDSGSPLNGNRPMRETTLFAKAAAARNRGARVLLVVSDPSHGTDQGLFHSFEVMPDADEAALPVLRVRRNEMQPLLDAWGLDALAMQINRDLRPRSRPLNAASVDYVEYLAHDRRPVRNVVGILPGSDPALAAEAVVIGAHYDHVGLGGRLSVTPERTGEVHNGADDNASGTASVIEMARAAVADRTRFPRTLIFVAFAGEERGLLGSAHYVSAPPVSMANTVAMLNLDMVGRARGSVDVSGLDVSAALNADFATAVRSTGGLDIKRAGPGAGRSDDSSFIDAHVPGINFFTGFHSDYHRPGDDWEKIDKEGTARVAALALEFAARIAQDPQIRR